MLTLHAAATLLAQADSLDALRPLARVLGFTGSSLDVHAESQRELGLTGLVTRAQLTSGPGSLRLLTASLDSPGIEHAGRELTRRLCSALVRSAPARQWCVITVQPARSELYIATVTPFASGPRVAALRVDCNRVVDSDADTLRALAGVTEPHDVLRHARFTDILRRDALSGRFYRALESAVTRLASTASGSASTGERRELALLCASRCIFLAFLEAKGWLNGDQNFLIGHVTTRLELGGRIHERLLRPLFFGTLNTPVSRRAAAARAFGRIPFLNGGLFSPTALEKRRHTVRFDDDALVALIGDLLDRYRFTAHEDSTAWSEAAVDPEMLGRAFESLMAADDRRKSGAFYTPPGLVDQVVRDAFACALPALPIHLLSGDDGADVLCDVQRGALRAQIRALRLLDPACGSGAFLVHALERLADLLRRLGDMRALHVVRRETLTRSIFGVDQNPMAVWLCELRLWLSVVIECPETNVAAVPPLPNLDHHVRVGNTLAGGGFEFAAHGGRAGAGRLALLRYRYTRATGRRKSSLGLALDREERLRALSETERRALIVRRERLDTIQRLRARDLFGDRARRSAADTRELSLLRNRQRELASQRRRLELGGALPFRFATHFADVGSDGGFSVVIGNPPWVRPHAVEPHERERLRAEFRTMRDASWQEGARRAGAGAGFSAQADLAAAFVERSAQLLAPSGTMALLVPGKLWRSLAGGGVRTLLAEETSVRTVRDWSEAPAMFEAATYPSLVVAQRTVRGPSPSTSLTCEAARSPVTVSVSRGTSTREFAIDAARLTLDGTPAAPWVLLPAKARDAFERLRVAGPALGDSTLGRPMLGVKCGCNAAFLVRVIAEDDECCTVAADGRTGRIERRLLRPVLRGEDAARLQGTERADGGVHIVWTHGSDGAPLPELPPHAARWIAPWRSRLERRKDAGVRTRWWALFRTDAAACSAPRLAWSDLGRGLRTIVLPPGDPTVPLNSCYVLRTGSDTDAFALHALLGSPLTAAWLDVIAEPARGGYRRYMGWTVACLPLPRDWPRARVPLAELGRRLHEGTVPCRPDYVREVAGAYRESVESMAPLLEWHSRADT